MKHTEEYTWTYDRTNSKGEVLLRHDTNESLEDVTGYLEEQGIKYERKDAAHMLWIFYGNKAYMYYYTTGRWASRNGWRKVPLKHYKSKGIKDFLDRFVKNKQVETPINDTEQDTAKMKQVDLFKNIEPHKLHRKNDPQTSKEAAYSVSHSLGKTRSFVLGLIEEAGNKGITVKEMKAAYPDMGYSTISSRPIELERLGLIFYKGDKRDKARVIRYIKYKSDE